MSQDTPVSPRSLGSAGPTVFPLALGCMGMSGMYGPSDERRERRHHPRGARARASPSSTPATSTAPATTRLLLGRALRGRRDRAVLSVKFGALRAPDGGWVGFDTRPAAVKNFLAYSLTRLGVDHVDIYRPTRLDPAVPIEDTDRRDRRLVKAGYVRAIGLSEVGAETIRRAHAVHPIADLQIEYSLISRGPEAKIFPVLRRAGDRRHRVRRAVARAAQRLATGRTGRLPRRLPRFTGENRAHNERLVAALGKLAAERGLTPSQLAIAWVLAKGEHLVPVIGARTRTQLAESLGALEITLSTADLARIEAAIPAGRRRGHALRRAPDEVARLRAVAREPSLQHPSGPHADAVPAEPSSPARSAVLEVASLFLKLGCVAFGGPAAHIAMMEDEVVRRRAWLSRERFLDLLGATNLIPGPNSTEMAIHVGHRRAGGAGSSSRAPASSPRRSSSWSRAPGPTCASARSRRASASSTA